MKKLIEFIKAKIRDRLSMMRDRWKYNDWKYRAGLVTKVVGVVAVLFLAIWVGLWFFFGPPSVEIGNIRVELDRSASLAGVDANKNGIRDDIDHYIAVLADKKGYDKPQVKALQQNARSMQELITVDVKSSKEVDAAERRDMDAINCLFDHLNEKDVIATSKQLEKLTANTKQRFLAYLKFSHELSGSVISISTGDTCEK